MGKIHLDENGKTGEEYLKEHPKYSENSTNWSWHYTYNISKSSPKSESSKDPIWKYYLYDNELKISR